MTKKFSVKFATTLWVLALGISTLARASTLDLTLDPADGSVTSPAGTTTGWGFTLTNDGPDFDVVTGTDFCVGILTSPCSNSFGTYTDFAGLQFLVIGPTPEQTSIAQSFDNTAMTGVGSFSINPASTGNISGYIALTYDVFSVDPNDPSFDPSTDTVSTGNYAEATASVTVGPLTAPTPEPSMALILIASVAGMCLLRFRQRRVVR